ncbi:CDP-alcohol phosphatidyltransferase family protein, partial [Oleiphilus sp. HI0043]|uniref:CDP-alcohol phosphatidyltransferase family protein n=4 Tax=Oleiphilus TaxID=141450 RepID=UPI003516B06C
PGLSHCYGYFGDRMIAANQIPNILTVIRILLVIPFAMSVYSAQYLQALILFFVAGLSDGVDGFLARQFNWKSRFGAIADPLADKLLLVTAYVMLAWTEQIPMWLLYLVIGRDVMILAGALGYHFFISHYDIKPSWLGKTCTMLQIVYVLLVIMSLADLPMPQWAVSEGLFVVGAITLISGIHYYLVWGVKAYKQRRENELNDKTGL